MQELIRTIDQDDLEGLETFSNYHWLLLETIAVTIKKRLGPVWVNLLGKAVHQYGFGVGQYVRDLPEVIVGGRNPLALFAHWDTGEIALAGLNGSLEVMADVNRVEAAFKALPGSTYFQDSDVGEIVPVYWTEFLGGLCEGFDESVSAEFKKNDASGKDEWKLVFWNDGAVDELRPFVPWQRLSDRKHMIGLNRRIAGLLGGLVNCVGRVLRDYSDGTGDAIFGELSYNFGAARGKRLRQKHLDTGRPLDFVSFFGGIQERDSSENVFVYRGDRFVSPGVFQLDCTYCPLAEVWRADGKDGLELAYLFDRENHRGLLESYNPEVVVRWDSIQSRGDKVCKFRFVIPSLISDSDPEWADVYRTTS